MSSRGSSKSNSETLRRGSTATLIILEQRLLLDLKTRRRREAQMLVGTSRCNTAAGGALEKSELDQIGFVDIHDRIGFFTGGGGKRLNPNRTAIELVDDRNENTAVNVVESKLVDIQHLERAHGNIARDLAITMNLRVVTNSLQQSIPDTRRSTRPQGNLASAIIIHRRFEDRRRTANDLFHRIMIVEIESQH